MSQSPPVAESAPLQAFAATCDAARADNSKLAKTKILAGYLQTLSAEDVAIAVRFLAAQAFSPLTGRTLGVGGAVVVDAVRAILQVDRGELSRAFGQHGEIGEAVSALWHTPAEGSPPLTLAGVQAAFHTLADTGGMDAKRVLVQKLLAQAHPREAVYLIKVMLGDLRTGVSEGVVEMAIAQAYGVTLAKLRKARLLVGDLEEVASLARAGRLEDASFRPFHPIAFMLAQPIPTAHELIETLADRPAVAEDKYDGIRAQLHVGRVGEVLRAELFSRGSDTVTGSFPDLVEPAKAFAQKHSHQFVLDGEVVPMRLEATGALTSLPFSTLQRRLGRKAPDRKFLRDFPCLFLAFDLLWLDGRLLLDEPLSHRRERLAALLAGRAGEGPPPFVVGPHQVVTTPEALDEAFKAARLRRNEGLVVKRLDSPYTPGRRGDAWLKLKSHLPTLDVVVVAAERGHGKRRGVLSDVTFAVRKEDTPASEFITLGKAYSGLTDAEIAQLTEKFLAETIEHRGRYHIVQPNVVLEVAFDQITRSDRHNPNGYALRFPRIARIRSDKTPAEIDTLARVREIYASPENLAVAEKESEAKPPPAEQMSLW